jgi:hypothetical protein
VTFWVLVACCYVTGVIGFWPEVKDAARSLVELWRRLL